MTRILGLKCSLKGSFFKVFEKYLILNFLMKRQVKLSSGRYLHSSLSKLERRSFVYAMKGFARQRNAKKIEGKST